MKHKDDVDDIKIALQHLSKNQFLFLDKQTSLKEMKKPSFPSKDGWIQVCRFTTWGVNMSTFDVSVSRGVYWTKKTKGWNQQQRSSPFPNFSG